MPASSSSALCLTVPSTLPQFFQLLQFMCLFRTRSLGASIVNFCKRQPLTWARVVIATCLHVLCVIATCLSNCKASPGTSSGKGAVPPHYNSLFISAERPCSLLNFCCRGFTAGSSLPSELSVSADTRRWYPAAPPQMTEAFDPQSSLASLRRQYGEHGGVNASIESSTTFTGALWELCPSVLRSGHSAS